VPGYQPGDGPGVGVGCWESRGPGGRAGGLTGTAQGLRPAVGASPPRRGLLGAGTAQRSGKGRQRPHSSPSWEVGRARIQGNSQRHLSRAEHLRTHRLPLVPQSLSGGAFTWKMDSASPWPPCLHPLSSLGFLRHSESHRGAHCAPGSAPAWLTTAPSLCCTWGIQAIYG